MKNQNNLCSTKDACNLLYELNYNIKKFIEKNKNTIEKEKKLKLRITSKKRLMKKKMKNQVILKMKTIAKI